MRLLITGGTGMIGSHIIKLCKTRGIKVNYLTRDPEKTGGSDDLRGFLWNPLKGEIDKDCIREVDKIIHLAGVNVAQRWTKSQRHKILRSRIQTAQLLKDLLAKEENQITQLVSASAIGIYPDSISKMYEETETDLANDFLGLVVKEWEQAADDFWELGVEVTKIRIGLVLAEEGGFLEKMKTPIKYFAGSCLGSGEQWQSWIHIDDLADMFLFLLENDISGTFNGVAPNPVKQKFLIESIAKHLNRKIILPPVPKPALRLALGKMSSMVVSSQLVSSKKIESEGFLFKYTQVDNALKNLLKN